MGVPSEVMKRAVRNSRKPGEFHPWRQHGGGGQMTEKQKLRASWDSESRFSVEMFDQMATLRQDRGRPQRQSLYAD